MSKFVHNNLEEQDGVKNEDFNRKWILEKGVMNHQVIDVSNLCVSEQDKYDANPFHVVWFKNIDRLMNMLSENIRLKDITFVDVGCGSGISTLYVADNYNFKKYIGFDFDPELIKSAELNRNLFKMGNKSLTFVQENARSYALPNEKCLLFMFNPFGLETMKIFIENNLDLLRETASIIAYANDLCIDYLDSLNTDVKRNEKFNLSLIRF